MDMPKTHDIFFAWLETSSRRIVNRGIDKTVSLYDPYFLSNFARRISPSVPRDSDEFLLLAATCFL